MKPIEKAKNITQKLGRYSNMEMAKPVSIHVIKKIYDAAKPEISDKQQIYGESNSIKEFVNHFLNNGWKLFELEKKYTALYWQAYFYLIVLIISMAILIRYTFTEAAEIIPVTTSVFFMLAMVVKYLECLCFMWRIRNAIINARTWPKCILNDVSELGIKPLREDYLKWLKIKYYQ